MSKEKLVELIGNAPFGINKQTLIDHHKESVVEELADYLLANGVIVPLVKLGDRIWQTDGVRIYESSVHEITYTASKTIYVTENIVFDETAIGESIFLTRSQAKAKLIEGG